MSKEVLKNKFSTGAKPTGNDFAELIEEIFSRASLDDLNDLSNSLTKAINKKANSEDIEDISDAILEFQTNLENFLTVEDIDKHLATKANSSDVYTIEQVDQVISDEISKITEEITSLREEIEMITNPNDGETE